MRIFPKVLLGVVFGVVTLASCTKEVEKPSNSDDYFPLKTGKYILYDVDSTVYNDHSKTTYHNRYQMRYQVVDSFLDGQGRLSYTINVYERPVTADEFYARDVIHVTRTSNGLEWTQSNVKLLKLAFPVSESTSWNGLAFVNARDEAMAEYDSSTYRWSFGYSNLKNDFDPGNNMFYNTVTVTGIDETTNVPDEETYADRNFYQEVYASGIGMVYRERIYWTYQPGTAYKNGYEVRMRAVEQN